MPFLIIAYILCTAGLSIGGKICSGVMDGEPKTSYGYYYITHSFIACLFYIVTGGFKISFNLTTFIYSISLAAVILVNMLVAMLILRCMNVFGSGILATPISLLLTAVSSALLWNEEITLSVCLKILVASIVSILVYIDTRVIAKKQNGDSPRGKVDLKKYVPLMLASTILTLIQMLITKSFAVSDKVTDEHSFYLMTGLTQLVAGVGILFYSHFKGQGTLRSGLSFFKPKRFFSTVGNVVISCANSLVTIALFSVVNLSVFSPISSAFGIFLGVVVSLIFREKLGIYSYIAAAIAILAIFV